VDAVLDNLGLLVDAFQTTVTLTVLAAVGALLLGTLIAAMRVSPVPPLRGLGAAYVNLVRNTPLTVVFTLVVFGLPEVGIIFSFFAFAVVALTVYTASFVAEAVRAGINSVPVGQAEAARAIGLTFGQSLRLVLLPQAVRTVIPPLGSVLIALLKNSSIAAGFGVFEATGAANTLANANGDAVLAIFAAVAFTYLVLALLMGAAFSLLERRLVITR
jgi:glutamate transport system permease protein